MRTVGELIHDYQHVIADLTLVMGSKGVFDVEVDGEVIYSKHASRRHAAEGEVLELFREHIGSEVAVYER